MTWSTHGWVARGAALAPCVVGGVVLLSLGCASTSRPHVEAAGRTLQEARIAGVETGAPIAFRDAERTLERAEAASEAGDDAEAQHLAQLSEERLSVAQAISDEKALRGQSDTLVDQATDRALAAREASAAAAQRSAASEHERADDLLVELQALQARQEPRGLVLTLGDILFSVDGTTLAPGAAPHLERLASFLRANPDRDVLIEGHTDSSGSDVYNDDLSLRRAEAVRDRLVALGVSSSRMRVVPRGESQPIASNETGAGRQQNRRVEVVVEPSR